MFAATKDRVRTVSRRVASFSLAGTTPADPVRIVDEEWRGLLADIAAQRLTGLALAAVEAEALELTPTQLLSLAERHRAAMLHALQLERLLLILADAFETKGLEMVVLKGPAMTHVRYADPAWRPFGDLDILVRTRDWRRVGALLAESGFVSKSPEPRPGFRERFGHTWVHTHESGLELDLHRTLVAGPFGLWTDPDELFDHTACFTLAGKTLRRLDDEATFLHACIHAVLGHRPPLLLPLRDVVEAAPPDWYRARALADRWRLRAVVSHALISASTTLTTELPSDAGSLISATETFRWRERRALHAYTTERRGRGGKALASLWAIRGLRAKADYLRALMLPDREFLAFREGGRGGAALRDRWAKPVRWLARH